MPPKTDVQRPTGISENQISLLIKVCKRVKSALTTMDSEEIAVEEGGTANGTRQRFRYRMYKIKAIDDYNNGREVGEYTSEKPVLKIARNRRAKKAESASVEEDGDNEAVMFQEKASVEDWHHR